MSSLLQTKSVFYYGYVVDENNYQLDFDESGAGPYVAELNVGSYTFESFADEIERALNATIGISNTYTVTEDRDTRTLTISATGNFDLLISSGAHASTSVFTLAGFTGGDVSGVTSAEGNNASGSEYLPQFLLQKYIDPTIFKNPVTSSVNRSANGEVLEIVTFGKVGFIEFNIRYATDIDQGKGNAIETNLNGVSDLISFMDAVTNGETIEFMKDRASRSQKFDILIESTKTSKDGVGYKLKELGSVPGYFETGILKFRDLT